MIGPTRRGAMLASAALTLTGCGALERLPAVPQGDTPLVRIPGVEDARFFDNEANAEITRAVAAARQAAAGPRGLPLPTAELLAISGGGEEGAFGAGLITAWTERGDRPEFRVVSGVSTGALSAPFAFLGPAWDHALRDVYTTIQPRDLLIRRWLTAVVFGDSLFDTTPLSRTIARFVDEPMLAEIAREYARGRLLLIGTTDLDRRRKVIWNIGKIAASNAPDRVELVRRVLLASAAIPGVFPPVLIDVEVEGRGYQEMHVDGGTMAQMFLLPSALITAARASGGRWPARAWLIRNARLDPLWASTDRRVRSIASAAISTMVHASGLNDIHRIHARTREAGIEFRLAFIGEDFTQRLTSPFEPGYMRALFAYGQQRMRTDNPWVTSPPDLG